MMKAVRIHDYGPPGVLCHEDAPTPEPGPREVLVRVHAAGMNPADRQIRARPRHKLEKPFALTLGCLGRFAVVDHAQDTGYKGDAANISVSFRVRNRSCRAYSSSYSMDTHGTLVT